MEGLGKLARQALEDFVQSATNHPEVAGVVLYGSALWKAAPNDFDLVILLDKPDYLHFYGLHPAGDWRCEVEYVSARYLDEYFSHPHWRVNDWTLDCGVKYVNGRILYDRDSTLARFRERLVSGEALAVRRYLFIHQIGQAASRLQKLAKAGEDQASILATEFVRAFDDAAHQARLTFPERGFRLEGWPLDEDKRIDLLSPGFSETKKALLREVLRQGVKLLGLDKLLAECARVEEALEGLPLYHLVDYGGLAEILKLVRPDLQLPRDLMLPGFSEEFGKRG